MQPSATNGNVGTSTSTKSGKHVKVHRVDGFGIKAQGIDAEIIAKGVFVKDELDVECVFKRAFNLGNGLYKIYWLDEYKARRFNLTFEYLRNLVLKKFTEF